MNIDYELKLKNDIKIGWKSNKKDVLRICKENNIDYISKTYGSIFKISLPIEFANLGKVIASIYFANDLIKEVYISSTDKKDFNILDYQITDEKLKKYFGPPKKAKNNNPFGNSIK